MPSIFDFPNEILFYVLDCLRVSDLDSLYAIPAFKRRLGSVVCVLVDKGIEPTYKNIPTVIPMDDFISKLTMYKSNTHCVIIEFAGDPRDVTEKLLPLTNNITNHVIFPPEDSKSKRAAQGVFDIIARKIDLQRSISLIQGSLTLSLSFNNERYKIIKAKLLGDKFSFPKAKALSLSSCTTSSFGVVPCPKLQSIQINNTPISGLFEVLQCPSLTILELSSTEDKFSWAMIPFQHLTVCVLILPNVHVFENISLPLLEHLIVEGPSTVRDLSFDNLKKLSITTRTPTLIDNLNLPKATSLKLSIYYFIGLSNINAPTLMTANVRINPNREFIEEFHQDQVLDFSFLEPVEGLVLCDHTSVEWNPQKTEELVIPVLSQLKQLYIVHDISLRRMSYLPLSKEVTELKIFKLYLSSSFDISELCSRYPKLSSLSVDMAFHGGDGRLTKFEALAPIYPNLKHIEVTHDGKVALEMKTCFPSLEKFSFGALVRSQKRAAVVAFSLSAPRLTELTLCHLPEFQLDLSDFPRIERLTAISCLSELSFGSSGRELVDLNIDHNTMLKELDAITFPKLRTLSHSQVSDRILSNADMPLISRRKRVIR